MTDIIFDENEDWEKRILCSDESCIGTIGSDGRCKECGRVYEGELQPEINAANIETKSANEQQSSVAVKSDDDWDQRILCKDESCIGVIGADGKCKECGKPL